MNKKMKKKLIFYFYITPDFYQRKTNLVHLKCLERYAHIFDEAEFYLSVDDIGNYQLIRRIEQELIKLPFNGNISFKVHQNDKFRESAIVKSEIADKIDTQDCLIFFAHGKGFTNLEQYNEEDMLQWLVGCYYLSLNFMDEVEHCINSNEKTWVAYGSFPLVSKGESPIQPEEVKEGNYYLDRVKYRWCYSGTFFWINTSAVYNHILRYNIKLPKMADRYYSEKLLGDVMPYGNRGTAHNNMYLFSNNNMYNRGIASDCIKFFLRGEEYEKYNEFYKEATNVNAE